MKIESIKFNPEDAYKLATIISNEYIGTENTILCTRKIEGYYYITSNRCDMCPFIKVYCSPAKDGIEKIEVNGDYTEGWQEVTQWTYDRIKRELN